MLAVYEITRVTKQDEGIYFCIAENAAGTSEERIMLQVEDDRGPTRGDIGEGVSTLVANVARLLCRGRYLQRALL